MWKNSVNWLALLSALLFASDAFARHMGKRAPAAAVRNLRARYDAADNFIYVEWEPLTQESSHTLRYKVNRKSQPIYGETNDNWQFASSEDYGSGETQFARLSAANLDNNDELLVQVKPSGWSEWSDTLLISIAKRSEAANGADALFAAAAADAAAELSPPLNFTANILAPDALRLEWTRSASEANAPGLYYIVDVRQTTAQNAAESAPPIYKQIKVESDNFLLGDLTPGEHFEMTIRSATSPEHVSSTAAIVEITLPKREEFFEVGNLIISSRFKSDGSGTVNLTWEIPPALVGKIVSYDVQYAESNGREQWHRILFPGNAPTVLLENLKSDREYLLKIKTSLSSGVAAESGEFKFRTPRVPANPIQKVDVIYSSETAAIRLQWILASHVSPVSVAGYDVFLSEDKDAPEERWRFLPLNSEAAEISLDDLRPRATYFAKIKVRLMDGTILDSPLLYKFTTIEGIPAGGGLESRMPDTLSYSNVGSGRVSLSWSYPDSILADVRGAKIFYTDQPNAPIQLWQKINVDDADQKSVVLAGLRESTIYFVQIVPVLRDGGALDFHNAESLQLRTE